MTRLRTLLPALIACTFGLAAERAEAGFFFEGLQPFSYRACPDRPEYRDPIVASPPVAVEGSPSAFNDGGVPRFQPQACPQHQVRGKAPQRQAPRPRFIHQK